MIYVLGIGFIVLLLGVHFGANVMIKEFVSKFKSTVNQAQKDLGTDLDIVLIFSLIWNESRGNPLAHNSKSDARGLMQITKPALTDYNNSNLTKLTLDDMFNPLLNLKVGIWYLNRLIKFYGKDTPDNLSLREILQAYNWGIGNMLKFKKGYISLSEMPTETKMYAIRVSDVYPTFLNLIT